MRRLPLIVVLAVAFALLWGALPASAQDIYGLSFRPTDAAPAESERGSVDMVAGSGDAHTVSVDLAKAADTLDLADYAGATAFVVWWVDMDGVRHNLGELDKDLMLEGAETDGLIARLFLTAEADATAAAPSGERLYEVTLRNVAEAADEGEAAKTMGTSAEESTSAEAAKESTDTDKDEGGTAAKDSSTTSSTEANPSVLPTTGSNARDLIVLLAVAAGLTLAGWRLKTLRV